MPSRHSSRISLSTRLGIREQIAVDKRKVRWQNGVTTKEEAMIRYPRAFFKSRAGQFDRKPVFTPTPKQPGDLVLTSRGMEVVK